MAVLNLVLSLVLAETFLRVHGLPEETFVQMPASLEDEDGYLYLDTRSESDPKQSETRRRSTLDKNFARFGRGGQAMMPLAVYDYDADGYVEDGGGAPRSPRSGTKSDQFVRFGRGNSDFVRFGRDPYKTGSRSQGDRHFIRFGRSVASADDKPRSKRAASSSSPSAAKRAGGNNFVRFGRNDNFMRFGRRPEEVPDAKQRQSPEYLMRLLMEVLTRAQPRDQSPRLA